jgi:hypothetical protein
MRAAFDCGFDLSFAGRRGAFVELNPVLPAPEAGGMP